MKKLLFILSLALFSCSAEEELPEDHPEYDYVIAIREKCEGGSLITPHQVSKDTFRWLVNQEPIEACKFITFEDMGGNTIEGIYSGWVGDTGDL